MKTIQMTLDDDLVDAVDKMVKKLKMTRSAFTRQALRNALNQAKLFDEAVGVTGIIITKLDGTAKGGIVVPIARELGIPIRFIGVGEGVKDLQEFFARDFAEALI